jgi:hypothetical protein
MSGPTPPRWQKSSPPSAREDFVMVAQKKIFRMMASESGTT